MTLRIRRESYQKLRLRVRVRVSKLTMTAFDPPNRMHDLESGFNLILSDLGIILSTEKRLT